MQGQWRLDSVPSVDNLSQDHAQHRDQINMGIAVVTPVNKLVEILAREELMQHKIKVASATRERLAATRAVSGDVPEAGPTLTG